MDRRDRIAGIATKVVFRFIAAGQQEETIFDAAFSVLRKKAREYKDSLEQSARDSLQKNLIFSSLVEDDSLVRMAKAEPEDVFGKTFFEMRKKIVDEKNRLAEGAVRYLRKVLVKDLEDRGYEVISADLSLGQYRGSKFLTSAKILVNVKGMVDAEKVAKHLLMFSPKFVLRGVENGVATYNIR